MDKRRLERIRLLSSHFHELQGLRVVSAGASMALGLAVYLFVTPNPTSEGALVALAISFVPVFPAMWWLNRYYGATFGRQVMRRPDNLFKSIYLPLIMFTVVGAWLNATFPEIPPGAPTAATVAFVSLWVTIRDWPWRGYYVGATIAVAIAFTARATGAIDSGAAVALTLLLTGVAMMAIGLLDHRLLVKLVQEARESQTSSVLAERAD